MAENLKVNKGDLTREHTVQGNSHLQEATATKHQIPAGTKLMGSRQGWPYRMMAPSVLRQQHLDRLGFVRNTASQPTCRKRCETVFGFHSGTSLSPVGLFDSRSAKDQSWQAL